MLSDGDNGRETEHCGSSIQSSRVSKDRRQRWRRRFRRRRNWYPQVSHVAGIVSCNGQTADISLLTEIHFMQWYVRLERRSGLWRQWLPAIVPNESSHRTHKHGYTKYRAKQTAKKEKKRSRYTKLFTSGRLGCHCLNRAGTRMVHRGRVKGMLRSGASPGSLRACRRGG